MTRMSCHQRNSDGLLVLFKLTPNARMDEILGTMETRDGLVIKAKVRAIPDKGKANKALIALVSKWLGIPKAQIEQKAGSKSRLKTLAVRGDVDELTKALAQALIQTVTQTLADCEQQK